MVVATRMWPSSGVGARLAWIYDITNEHCPYRYRPSKSRASIRTVRRSRLSWDAISPPSASRGPSFRSHGSQGLAHSRLADPSRRARWPFTRRIRPTVNSLIERRDHRRSRPVYLIDRSAASTHSRPRYFETRMRPSLNDKIITIGKAQSESAVSSGRYARAIHLRVRQVPRTRTATCAAAISRRKPGGPSKPCAASCNWTCGFERRRQVTVVSRGRAEFRALQQDLRRVFSDGRISRTRSRRAR